MSRASSEMNEPTAFFDFSCKKGHQFDKKNSSQLENAKFEMNREELGEIMRNLNEIQKKIEENS